jgi:hypothetical protein
VSIHYGLNKSIVMYKTAHMQFSGLHLMNEMTLYFHLSFIEQQSHLVGAHIPIVHGWYCKRIETNKFTKWTYPPDTNFKEVCPPCCTGTNMKISTNIDYNSDLIKFIFHNKLFTLKLDFIHEGTECNSRSST